VDTRAGHDRGADTVGKDGLPSWLAFWDADNSIYVNERHVEAHYRRLFTDIGPLLPQPPFTLLDYGCGEALMAPALAAEGARVLLFDAAPSRCAVLAKRFAGIADVEVLDDVALRSLPSACCDRILLISVIQYLDRDALARLLAMFRHLLTASGRLVIGDIVPPGSGMTKDVTTLLSFAWKNGFLVAAAAGLLRTLSSDYRKVRKQLGFATYTQEGLTELMAEQGWRCEVLKSNIGHARHRWSLTAWPVA